VVATLVALPVPVVLVRGLVPAVVAVFRL